MENREVYEEFTGRSKNGTFAEGRLTRDEQLRVIQWCVELKDNQEISELIQEEFKKTISRQAVWKCRNSRKWRPLIKRLRERFEKNLIKIPCANKIDRLRVLQKVIDEGLKWSLKNITKEGDEIYELKLSAVTQAVKEARTEIEGDKPKIETHLHLTTIKQVIENVVEHRKSRSVSVGVEGQPTRIP